MSKEFQGTRGTHIKTNATSTTSFYERLSICIASGISIILQCYIDLSGRILAFYVIRESVQSIYFTVKFECVYFYSVRYMYISEDM